MSGLVVSGLSGGDTIDLTNVAFVSGATAFVSGSELVVSAGGSWYALRFGPANSLSGDTFTVTSDGNTGTDVAVSAGSDSSPVIVARAIRPTRFPPATPTQAISSSAAARCSSSPAEWPIQPL